MTAEGSPTPGRPLWEAAEHARAEHDWTVEEFAARAGIGRMTYNRLATNDVPPRARTVKKIAAAINMPLAEAIRLSGLTTEQRGTGREAADELNDTARLLRGHLDRLREIGSATGRTLGQVLVDLKLVTPDELHLDVKLIRGHQDAG